MLDEEQIIQLMINGHTSLYSELFTRHKEKVHKVVYKILKNKETTDDVLQKAFIKGLTKIHTFNGTGSFIGWLLAIAKNEALNSIRTRRYYVEINERTLGLSDVLDDNIYKETIKEELGVLIEELPPKQKQILKLRIYENMKLIDISKKLNTNYNTTKRNYLHAIDTLKLKTENSNIIKGRY